VKTRGNQCNRNPNEGQPVSNAKKLVAIVVPLSLNPQLNQEEEISLRHLRHYLGEYDKFMVAPVRHPVTYDGFEMKYFEEKYFGSATAHKKLSFSRDFYETFSEYQYMLMYHLDALVFSNKLLEWCATDLDYIGAPWVKHVDAPYHGKVRYEGKVGNSGFSLRKISSFLKVIESCQNSLTVAGANSRTGEPYGWVAANAMKAISFLQKRKSFRGSPEEMNTYPFNDDTFWANRATHYYADFKIASLDVALRFAFECVPKYCFEITGHTLPFGCHAWARYDRKFWESYILK